MQRVAIGCGGAEHDGDSAYLGTNGIGNGVEASANAGGAVRLSEQSKSRDLPNSSDNADSTLSKGSEPSLARNHSAQSHLHRSLCLSQPLLKSRPLWSLE